MRIKNHNTKSVAKFRPFRKAVFYSLVPVVLAGPIVFQLVSTLLPFFNKGYDLVRDAVSELVFGAYGWLQTAGFYSFGVSLLALAVIVFIKTKMRVNPGMLALAYIGLGFVMIGAFKGNGPGLPPGYTGIIHQVTVGIVVVAFPIACLLMAPILKAWGYRKLRIYTIAVGIFATLFMVVGGPLLALHYALPGIFERVLLWNGQLWVLVTCTQLVIDDMRKRRRYAFAYANRDEGI